MSSSSTSIQNMAFVSSSNNNSTNGAVNTAQAVNTAIEISTTGTQVNTANIDNLSDAVICAFLATLVSCDELSGYDWSDQAEEGLNFELMAYTSSNNCKKGLGYENYNVVPPPYTGNFMPPKPELSFTGLDEFTNKPVVENSKAESSQEKPKEVRKKLMHQLLRNGCQMMRMRK
nr:hypothetical protein [Tanacetum cinerariifolium]